VIAVANPTDNGLSLSMSEPPKWGRVADVFISGIVRLLPPSTQQSFDQQLFLSIVRSAAN
jgi:hypothetical protein